MKMELNAESFAEVLRGAVSVSPQKTVLPILNHCLLEAGESGACITSTDMETTMRQPLPFVSVTETGALCIPTKKIFDVVKLLDGCLTLTTSGTRLALESGSSRFVFTGLDAAEYPQMSDDKGNEIRRISLPAGTLAEMIRKTLFSVSKDGSRPALSGLLFQSKPSTGQFRLVSTDGVRLSLATEQWCGNGESDADTQHVISAKAAAALGQMLRLTDDIVDIALTERQIVFSFGGVVVATRTLGAPYPNYERIIPAFDEDGRVNCTLSREDFQNSVRRLFAVADLNAPLDIETEPGIIRLSVAGPENEGSAVVSADDCTEARKLRVDPRLFLEGLNAVVSRQVTLSLPDQDKHSPVLITDNPGNGYLYLLMPLNVRRQL